MSTSILTPSNNKHSEVLLSVRNLKKYFPIKKKSMFSQKQEYVRANESITLNIFKGETLGLVGESGCGKSTLGRTIVQLYEQTDGSTLYYGETLAEIAPRYAKEVMQSLTKQYPEFLKAERELIALEEEAKRVVGSDVEQGRAQEKVTLKLRDIHNKYQNIFRIAGGLVTHPDLKKVSAVLIALYESQVKLADARLEINELETSKTNPKNANKIASIDEKINQLLKTESALEREVEEREVVVENLRNECQHNDRFEEFEAQRNDGIDLSKLETREMRRLRRDLQIIFQDPYSSLNPRMTVGQIIGEGVLAHGIFESPRSPGYQEYIQEIMGECGLAPYFIHRYPHQFSGGQRQRIGIARALALRPRFIVCDEAVSALDVSIQSQVINLLQDLKEEFSLTYLFITHDLSVVKYISDRVAVMYLGHIVELTESDKIFENPLHPYTKALLQAIPRTDIEGGYELQILEGDIPSAVNPPKGCKFNTRCKYAFDKCFEVEPQLLEARPGHEVACHLYEPHENETI